MRLPGAVGILAGLVLVLATGAAAEAPAWLAADIGAPYVALAETPEGDFEVGSVQFVVTEDLGGALRVRVRASDEFLAAVFGAGDYLVRRDTGQVSEAAEGSLAARGERLGFWLEPDVRPSGNATVDVLGADFRARPEPEEGAALTLDGRVEAPLDGERATLAVARSYRADGLLLGAVVRLEAGREGPVPLLGVDLAAAGPTAGGLPPELAAFALLGPGSFVAAFGAMLLARRAHHLPPPARQARFCSRCGAGMGEVPSCPRCGAAREGA